MAAEGGRQTCVTQRQPSAHEDNPSRLEAYHGLIGRLEQVENEIRKITVWSVSVESRLRFLESCHRQHAGSDHYQMQETNNPDPPYQEGYRSYQEAFPGEVTQKELHETEELKKKIKELDAKNKELLSKAMSMHKDSEKKNDLSHLSAVLQMYEILRLCDWEKIKTDSCLTYQTGRSIIKKLFNACEKDIEQRTTSIFEVLGISPSNDAMTNGKEGMMQAIRNLFRYHYYQSDSEFYSKIIRLSGPFRKLSLIKLFADLSMREQRQLLDAGTVQKPGLSK